MPKMRLEVFVVLALAAFSSAAAQGDEAVYLFKTTGYVMAPQADQLDLRSQGAEWSRTCTYQGGSKSWNWVCR